MTAPLAIVRTFWDTIVSNPVGSGMGTYGVATRLAALRGRA